MLPDSLLLRLLLGLLLVPLSSLSAQQSDQSNDPTLRLLGERSDSITGGMPSVGIRKRTSLDRRVLNTHAVSIDPFLARLYFNLNYEYTIMPSATVGLHFQGPVVWSDPEQEEIFGIGVEARYYPFSNGIRDLFLRVAPTHYSGTYRDYSDRSLPDPVERDIAVGVVVADLGWRQVIYGFSVIDAMIGIEKQLGGGDLSDNVLLIASEDTSFFPHFAVRVGVVF